MKSFLFPVVLFISFIFMPSVYAADRVDHYSNDGERVQNEGRPGKVIASDANPMVFSLVNHCFAPLNPTGHSPSCYQMVRGEGIIYTETPRELSNFIAQQQANGVDVEYVSFDSPGGNVGGAIRLGIIIRQAGLNTFVAPEDDCWSACPYAFLGGITRHAQGYMGIHAVRRINGEAYTEDEETRLNNEIQTYIGAMGGDPQMLTLAQDIPHTQMYRLSPREIQLYNLDNSYPLVQRFELGESSISRLPMLSVLQQQPLSDTRHLFRSIQVAEQPQYIASILAIQLPRGVPKEFADYLQSRPNVSELCLFGLEEQPLRCIAGPIEGEWNELDNNVLALTMTWEKDDIEELRSINPHRVVVRIFEQDRLVFYSIYDGQSWAEHLPLWLDALSPVQSER